MKYPLILASKSPRRQELLTLAGIPFSIQSKETEEHFPATLPVAEVAAYLARLKADAFSQELLGPLSDHLLLTADTTVVVDDLVLNKPADAAEARQMLEMLSGRSHQVISGACLAFASQRISFEDSTEVFFRTLRKEEITHYIDQYQPFDKAGAYGIQEWIGMIGIEKIIGSYYNVMGLPVHKVYQELEKFSDSF